MKIKRIPSRELVPIEIDLRELTRVSLNTTVHQGYSIPWDLLRDSVYVNVKPKSQSTYMSYI